MTKGLPQDEFDSLASKVLTPEEQQSLWETAQLSNALRETNPKLADNLLEGHPAYGKLQTASIGCRITRSVRGSPKYIQKIVQGFALVYIFFFVLVRTLKIALVHPFRKKGVRH
ncbi:MAG TPA: hypothetical protein VGR94_09375 [Candidatus Acidoferrales bacterium]|nr:hypothetical protein [Candidatus Acidoferrales bacterium]